VGIEEALQNQHGSDLIDDSAVLLEGPADRVQMAMGLSGREPFIPEMHGQSKSAAKSIGERLHVFRLAAYVAGHVQRKTEHNSGALEFAEQATQRFEVLLRVFALQGHHRLRRQTQLVRNRHTNAAAAKVESQKAS
jgi:hypothetical protein